MMLEFVTDFVVGIVSAAEFNRYMLVFEHEGPPTRYIVRSPDGECDLPGCRNCNAEIVVTHGQTVVVNRRMRLRVEPLDTVMARPLATVLSQWATS